MGVCGGDGCAEGPPEEGGDPSAATGSTNINLRAQSRRGSAVTLGFVASLGHGPAGLARRGSLYRSRLTAASQSTKSIPGHLGMLRGQSGPPRQSPEDFLKEASSGSPRTPDNVRYDDLPANLALLRLRRERLSRLACPRCLPLRT